MGEEAPKSRLGENEKGRFRRSAIEIWELTGARVRREDPQQDMHGKTTNDEIITILWLADVSFIDEDLNKHGPLGSRGHC